MTSYRLSGEKKRSSFPGLWKVTQFLYEFAFCTQFLIVMIFWGFIVPQLGGLAKFGGLNILLNTQLHGGLFIAIIIDTVLNNIEFIKSHLHIVFTVTLFYCVINMFYSLTWEPVYPGITWKNV